MGRADFEDAVLAEVKARLGHDPFLVRDVEMENTSLVRDADTTDLVVLFVIRSGGGSARYGWQARIWPAYDLPPEAMSQNLVSSLVERVEAGDAVLDGPDRNGVRWLTSP